MPISHARKPSPSAPQLTDSQRRDVERAREVLTADAHAVAAEYDDIDPGDLAKVYGHTLGVTRANLAQALAIIDELTGGTR